MSGSRIAASRRTIVPRRLSILGAGRVPRRNPSPREARRSERDAMHGDAELGGLVEEVLGNPGAGEPDDALGQKFQQLIVSAERSGLAVGVPVRACRRPGARPWTRPNAPRSSQHPDRHRVPGPCRCTCRVPDRAPRRSGWRRRRAWSRHGHEGALRQVRLGLLVLSGAEEVAGIDRRGGELRRAADVRAVPGSPGVAGVGSGSVRRRRRAVARRRLAGRRGCGRAR